MVEKIYLSGYSRKHLKWIVLALLLPLYSVLLWYLGSIYNPELVWSWKSFLINIAYCLAAVFLISKAIDLVLKRTQAFGNVSKLMISILTGIGVYLILQSVILRVEKLDDKVTVNITYSLGLLISILYILVYFFSDHFVERKSLVYKPEEVKQTMLKAIDKGKTLMIAYTEILHIESIEKITFLTLRDGKKLTTNTSLSDLEKLLPKEHFFRINRQVIVHKQSIERSERLENNTLSLCIRMTDLKPSVSRRKVAAFNKWNAC